MCRVFDDSESQNRPNSILKTLSSAKSTLDKERDIYVKLITESLDLLRTTTPNLTSKSFANPMFYYVLEIFHLLIKTNVLDLLNADKYSEENKYSDYALLMEHMVNIINFDEQQIIGILSILPLIFFE